MRQDDLENEILRRREELSLNGCLELPDPQPRENSLKNEIHPIFQQDRWMHGYAQNTEEFYLRMRPALRLASKFITEDCTLPWFHHVTHGPVKTDPRPYGKIYIGSSKHEYTHLGQKMTKDQLLKLSKVITLLFLPHDYYMVTGEPESWGVTVAYRSEAPWRDRFHKENWPTIPKVDRRKVYKGLADPHPPHPVISLNGNFREYYMRDDWYKTASHGERYRVHFMFAVTLVHELAHAYAMFLRVDNGDWEEPYWKRSDKLSELGYSWESVVLGHIMQPLKNEQQPWDALCSFQMEVWDPRNLKKDHEIRRRHQMPEGMAVKNLGRRAWRSTTVRRGYAWFCAEDQTPAHRQCLMVVHAIPMAWIMQFFHAETWNRWADRYRRSGKYTPPCLGPTLMVMYERTWDGWASLMTGSRVDSDPYRQSVIQELDDMHMYDQRYWDQQPIDNRAQPWLKNNYYQY